MSWFDKLVKKEPKSANVAKERLMIAIATDRKHMLIPNMDAMRQDIIEVLQKYTKFDDVEIKKEKKGDIDILEIAVSVRE